MSSTSLIDISPAVGPDLAVWPGDVPPLVTGSPGKAPGTIQMSLHTGAHVDAPVHVQPGQPTIDTCNLTPFVGPCQVIRADVAPGCEVELDDLQTPPTATRILLCTGYPADRRTFREDFAAPSVALVDALHTGGVELLGVDTPSVDLFRATDMPVHKRLLSHGITILEGIVLVDVPPGDYELIALPLKLAGCDGSPVRAVLRPRE